MCDVSSLALIQEIRMSLSIFDLSSLLQLLILGKKIFTCFMFSYVLISWKNSKIDKLTVLRNSPTYVVELVESLNKCNLKLVKTISEESSTFQPKRGVRWRCLLSPWSSIYIWNRLCDRPSKTGIDEFLIGFRRISNLRHADDTTLVSTNEEQLVELINRVKAVSKEL